MKNKKLKIARIECDMSQEYLANIVGVRFNRKGQQRIDKKLNGKDEQD